METLKPHVFIGHVFNSRYRDDLRRAIREALEANNVTLRLCYADDEYVSGDIWTKIAHRIGQAMFCIFECSVPDRPNVFIELGYALALGKKCVVLVEQDKHLPSDLGGFDRVVYASMKQATEALQKYLPDIVKAVIKQGLDTGAMEDKGQVDLRVLRILLSRQSGISRPDLHDLAKSERISYDDVEETLRTLESTKTYLRVDGDLLILTNAGLTFARDLTRNT